MKRLYRPPRPTSSADLPEARRFVAYLRARRSPASGLYLLSLVGNHEQASAMLRALEDISHEIRSTGSDSKCPKAYRGDLVGQLYEAC